jgi:predicted protein tyrosine phosphatase
MKILFICNQGENRSRMAADIWRKMYPEHQVEYFGFYNNFNSVLLDWADKIIVFEKQHEDELKEIDYEYWKKSYNISIEDVYSYNSSILKEVLYKKLKLIPSSHLLNFVIS